MDRTSTSIPHTDRQTRREGTLSKSFGEAHITPISKKNKDKREA